MFCFHDTRHVGLTQLITRLLYNDDKELLSEIKTRSAQHGLTVIERSRNTQTTNTARCA